MVVKKGDDRRYGGYERVDEVEIAKLVIAWTKGPERAQDQYEKLSYEAGQGRNVRTDFPPGCRQRIEEGLRISE